MGSFLRRNGGYHEGVELFGDTPCQKRPDVDHILIDDPLPNPMNCWREKDADDLDADKELSIKASWDNRFNKFLFLLCWDQENRLRVIESKPELTQQQYFDALKNKAKKLDDLLEINGS